MNFKKLYNYLDLVIIIFFWIFLFFWIFYKGSVNVGIWGKWQGLEILLPLIISFLISSIIMLPIYLLRRFLKNKRK